MIQQSNIEGDGTVGIRLVPLVERAFELLAEQGIVPPITEIEAADFAARIGNDPIVIVVGPHALYARNRLAHTSALTIKPGDSREEVRALGQIAASMLAQKLRTAA
ncbi:MAG: hypothetical protein AAFY65_01185 [Pseudomonadota bacterium]